MSLISCASVTSTSSVMSSPSLTISTVCGFTLSSSQSCSAVPVKASVLCSLLRSI